MERLTGGAPVKRSVARIRNPGNCGGSRLEHAPQPPGPLPPAKLRPLWHDSLQGLSQNVNDAIHFLVADHQCRA
jgi:hypothetical protein